MGLRAASVHRLYGEQNIIVDVPCGYKEDNSSGQLVWEIQGSILMTNYRFEFVPDWSTQQRHDKEMLNSVLSFASSRGLGIAGCRGEVRSVKAQKVSSAFLVL